MEEIELSEQCRLGNNRARKELYEQYAGRMLGICLRYTGDRDTAQDLLHDGFLKIFDSFDKFTWRGEGSLRAWMERVMVNTVLQYLRKNDVINQSTPLEELPEEYEEPDASDVEAIPQNVLMQFIEELPAGYRTVFNLYTFEDKSHKEIAQEKELMPPVEKKIYPYRKWMMAAAAIIILAVVSSVSLYFLGTPAADEIRHIQTPALASTPDALPGVQQPDMQGTAVEPVLRPVTREDRLAKVDRNHTEQKTGVDPLGIGNENKLSTGNGEDSLSEEDKNVKGNGETENVKDESKQAENTDVSQGQSQDTERSNNRPRRPSGKDKLHIPTEKRSSQKGTWSMGLSVGNSGGASTEVGAGSHAYMSRVSMLSVSNGLMETIPNDQTLVFEDGVPYLRQAKQVVDIKHHQPISFGLSVRKGLAKGFSLETGLTYTLLSSDAKLAGEEQQIEQKLHYIGIPLRANWNFLDKKLVTLYVSGGGMVEKCVYGKLGSEKETVKPLQFSVSGGVGAQINATKRLGIYVEPGVAYYFNDGSDIQTIRKENPFNFNIQAGVRLTY